jgi:TonB family protein
MRRIAIALLLTACSTQPAPVTAPTATAPAQPTTTVRVTASALNVRADASTSAAVVTQVRRGTRLSVLADSDGWLRVRLASGEEGWVSAQHVSRDLRAQSDSPRRRGCPPDSDYRFLKTPVPTFSDSGAHGLVIVEANVNENGVVTSTKVVSNGTGDEALAFLAEKEIRSAAFEAPVRNCVRRTFIFTYKRTF